MPLKMLWATLGFITRIPVPQKWSDGVEFSQYGRGVPWFPVVGLIVGVLAALGYMAVSQTGGGISIGAVAWVLALVLLTGGFHLDGLADTCDGVFSARTRERMLEIMRDSRLGTYGGLAIVFCILIKVAAVISLAHLPVNSLFTLLVCVPIVGRTGMVLAMYRQHYAREGAGMANAYLGHISGKETVITLCIGVALVGLLAGIHGLVASVITWIVVNAEKNFLSRRLNGLTGDTLGAMEEIGEMVFLLALQWV
ncbi:adenosylcobinamide-GDP ribazoletransferase [Klebsiella aerogenes]|uniref:adenosylcobinamide-GDP ribazoletransferase n=1 Tax=Klebsiella aerogenes TaxID=548 RepID=UPI00063CE61F|nr:adenosylcobinamide-GDP ribazoletransferase [Klebsiella aerogenes]EMB4081180.1 adenosylcobinamide-GDP ribazoletransferase [Klebsiella aerogenes]KLF52469.1 cobalamin synthase [Klebsiella aerogenes]